MSGKLYIVGTPIGNLEDFSLRGIETLKKVDYILAEDTRVSLKLLNNFDIKKKLISYYKEKEKNKEEIIINDLISGKNIALISDAGMPIISDPGAILVRSAIKNNIKVITIPGPSAGITAFANSGLLDGKYIFYGFMKNINELNEIMYNEFPTIIYESPNRIKKVLEKISELDKNRYLIIGRELTKIHEEYYYGTANEIKEKIIEKGEMVLIIDKSNELYINKEDVSFKEVYKFYLQKGFSKKDIIKKISLDYNLPKNEVYKEFTND